MRKMAVAAVCAAAALTLAGCSSSATTDTGTSAGGTAASSPAVYGSTAELTKALGAATEDKKSAKMTFDFGTAGQSMKGQGAYAVTDADVTMQMTMDAGAQGRMELLLVDRTLYIQAPGLAQGDKPWIRFSADGDNPVVRQLAGLTDQIDVTRQFDQLNNGGTITAGAPDTLNGTPTTKYSITIDTAKAAAAATPEQKQQYDTLVQQGITAIDMQLWVDAGDLPRQVATSIPVQGRTTTATVGFSDWGSPVTVTAPPADQVAELPGS
jgi:hypothetical protein